LHKIIWGSFAVSVLSVGRPAQASDAFPTSDPCHHTLPNGALIRHPSGEVYLDGQLIATYPDADCNAYLAAQAASGSGSTNPDGCGSHADACTSNATCCTPHGVGGNECGWSSNYCYDSFWANEVYGTACASCESGLQSPAEYNQLGQHFTVPSLPVDTSINYELFFIALTGSSSILLQPEIYYNPQIYGSSGRWQVRSEAWSPSWDDQVGNGSDFNVPEGDTILVSVVMTAGGGGSGQETTWNIVAQDNNDPSIYTILTETLTGYSAFNQVDNIYELHGIDACDGTPTQNELAFNMTFLGQSESSFPIDSIYVGGVQTWSGKQDATRWPDCSWGASPASTGGTPNTLTWTN
jgi:hypothetical protein